MASEKVRKEFERIFCYLGRYRLEHPPIHVSATCKVYFAADHGRNLAPVALKFMRHRDQILREIRSRQYGTSQVRHAQALLIVTRASRLAPSYPRQITPL